MVYFCLSLFILSAISACSSTQTVATWADSEYKGGPLKKIVVVGVFKNLLSRREFEEKIAKEINDNSGVEAIPSLRFMQPGVKYDHKKMEKMFNEKGFDGILIVRTKSVDNRTVYVPSKKTLVTNVRKVSSPNYPIYGGYPIYPSYHDYYVYTWKSVREPAYFDESYIVSTESSLFLNSNEKMIWTMENSTEENYKSEDGITNPKSESVKIAGYIVKSLKAEKLLIPAGKGLKK